jgi:hypothetical protein
MLQKLQDALQKMQDALALLDLAGAPADIGAHLDLTIVRLEEFIGREDNSGASRQTAEAAVAVARK